MLTDYHVHLRPDEPGTTAEPYFTAENADRYREAAAERGIAELGVSEHVYRFHAALDVWNHPFWCQNAADDLDEYVEFVREETDLRLGIEADFVPGREDRMANLLERYEWDYVVGSVHFLRDHAVDMPGAFDVWGRGESPEKVWALLRDARRGGAQRPVRHHGPPRPREDLGARPAAPEATCASTTSRPSRRSRTPAWPSRSPPPGCASRSARSTRRAASSRWSSTRAADRAVERRPRPEHLGYGYDEAVELLGAVGVTELSVFEGRERRMEPIG